MPPPGVTSTPEPIFTPEEIPGGTAQEIPSIPSGEGNSLFEFDGIWIELDNDGVPLGTWVLNEEGIWIFSHEVPMAALPFLPVSPTMPTTNFNRFTNYAFVLLGLNVLFIIILIKRELNKCPNTETQ